MLMGMFSRHHVNIRPSVLSEACAEIEADIVVVEWWATFGTKSSSILVNQALNALCCCVLRWSVIWNRATTYISGSPFVWLIGQELSQFSLFVPAKVRERGYESLPLTKWTNCFFAAFPLKVFVIVLRKADYTFQKGGFTHYRMKVGAHAACKKCAKFRLSELGTLKVKQLLFAHK